MEAQGYHATGLNQIVKESGAPKGSLYYHFPDGKEELVAEAIARTGHDVSGRIEKNLAYEMDPAISIPAFIRRIADNVESSGFRAGGPLMTVAMETAISNERINGACREAYGRLVKVFETNLLAGGHSEQDSAEMALFIIAAIEGGIILSRTNHTGDPLRLVAKQIKCVLQAERS
jgi:TetR/AcrR family transcriptional repressor of lmrAB and yxaGH operons